MGLSTAISGDQMIQHKDWNIKNVSRIYAIEARYTFFWSNVSSACADSTYKIEHTAINIVLSVVQFLLVASRRLYGSLGDVFLFSHCVLLWLPMRSLRKLTRNCETARDVYEILEGYSFLKEASTKVNNAISPLIFCYIFDCMLYLSSNMDTVLINPNWFGKIRILLLLTLTVSLAWFSAELCVMVSLIIQKI